MNDRTGQGTGYALVVLETDEAAEKAQEELDK